ncbi:hypothetical protein [Verminephrobacter aporrectodeae]|nr:hypothetical protein [Verminephrobacter aporrectodeae]
MKYPPAHPDGTGMHHDQRDGQPAIHPGDDTRVRNLNEAIRAAARER